MVHNIAENLRTVHAIRPGQDGTLHSRKAQDCAHDTNPCQVQTGMHTSPAQDSPSLKDQAGIFQIHPYVLSIVGPVRMILRLRYPVAESDHIDISMVQFKENIWGF